MTREELMHCGCADIMDCSPELLVDLKQIEVTSGLPVTVRMEHYLEQIQNPYLFRIDKLIVKASFSGTRELSKVLADLMAQS